MPDPYVSVTSFKLTANIQSSGEDADLERALGAASRAIDHACDRGLGAFRDSGSATARVFRADDPHTLWVDDFHTTTGLVVETDTTGDGTYDTTWDAADYLVEPFNPDDGWPYTRLLAVGTRTFPAAGRRPRVRVTAQWGWAEVPEDIQLATQLLAKRYLARRSSAELGVVAFGEAVGRIATKDPDVHSLIQPYMRHPVMVA